MRASWGEADSGRRRRYYQLTQKGKDELESQRRQWQVVNETLQGTPFHPFQMAPQAI